MKTVKKAKQRVWSILLMLSLLISLIAGAETIEARATGTEGENGECAHEHEWEFYPYYNAIVAECALCPEDSEIVYCIIYANDMEATGEPYTEAVVYDEGWTDANLELPVIKYAAQEGSGTVHENPDVAPTELGSYTAYIEYGEILVGQSFDIFNLSYIEEIDVRLDDTFLDNFVVGNYLPNEMDILTSDDNSDIYKFYQNCDFYVVNEDGELEDEYLDNGFLADKEYVIGVNVYASAHYQFVDVEKLKNSGSGKVAEMSEEKDIIYLMFELGKAKNPADYEKPSELHYTVLVFPDGEGFGSATASALTATPGALVYVSAEPGDRSTFARWEAENVTFEDATKPNTSFIMPANVVDIRAVFDRIYTEQELRIMEAEKLIAEAAEAYVASNDTTEKDLLAYFEAAKTEEYADLILGMYAFSLLEASTETEGELYAIIELHLGDEFEVYIMDVIIDKLPAPTSTPTPIPTSTPIPVPTVIPVVTATPVPTATPAPTATPIPTPIPGVSTVPSMEEAVVDEAGNEVASIVQTAGTTVKVSIPELADTEVISWESSDTEVATVDAEGNISLNKAGMAEITVTVGEGKEAKQQTIVVVAEAAPEYVNAPEEAAAVILLGTSKKDVLAVRYLATGEQTDINFYGVRNWVKNRYEYSWSSSDETVATVDKNGNVTALKPGVVTIELKLKNKETGKFLNVKPVKVVIPEDATEKIALGTSKKTTFESLELKLNERVDINFYGVKNWKKENYEYQWISSDPTVAWVDAVGKVTPVQEGTATITLILVDKNTGNPKHVVPVNVTVSK